MGGGTEDRRESKYLICRVMTGTECGRKFSHVDLGVKTLADRAGPICISGFQLRPDTPLPSWPQPSGRGKVLANQREPSATFDNAIIGRELR